MGIASSSVSDVQNEKMNLVKKNGPTLLLNICHSHDTIKKAEGGYTGNRLKSKLNPNTITALNPNSKGNFLKV
jgi:hypothetical protein